MNIRKICNHITFGDALLVCALLLIAFLSIVMVPRLLSTANGVTIVVDDKPLYRLSLEKDVVIPVQGPEGNTIVEIRDRKVRIADAPCPDKRCSNQGWVAAGSIICLPNKVMILIGKQENPHGGIDAITE